MTSARRVGETADDVLAFHESRHGALKGILAPDLYGNLPRHLRSEVTQPNSAPFRIPPTDALRFSPYQTPQWAELSECMREVSSPPIADADVFRVAASQTEFLSRSLSSTASFPGYEMVKRLADLSQASDVDPEAVAAALREAESVLEASTDLPTPQEYARCNSAADVEHSSAKGHSPLHRTRATSSVASPASAAHRRGNVRSQRPQQNDVHHQLRRREFHPCDGDRIPSSDRVTTAAEPRPTAGCHTSSPWGCPVPTPTLSGSLALPYPAHSGVNMPVGNPTSLSASNRTADTADPTMRWYEVYYAWMLYYQQLYATQVLQGRHRQRARRGKREGRHRRTYGSCAAPGEVSTEHKVSADPHEDGTEYAHARRQHRSAARPGRSHLPEEGDGGMVGSSSSMCAHPIRHNRSTSLRQPIAEACSSRTRRVPGEKNTKAVDEAARVRAELRRLEEKYAVMSSWLANKEKEETRSLGAGIRRTGHATTVSDAGKHFQRSQSAKPRASEAPRAQSGKWLGRCDDADQTPHLSSLAPAETWQALSERQRNGTLSGVVRIRTDSGSSQQRFPRQRAQWRH
ncbi:hypothetical protein JKF63_01837 [Porcisia hertigi]|uniref:Uncharacterized protein n=1 Tax=Porcisia hertigi TaxID=2761500 RepID=A0A836HLX3_9TRYP|nr:hypothetical protein JKF63_01837 [Porcisia hertigi]